MDYTFKYELVDGHIIVNDGPSRLLIDTGSPITVSDRAKISFCGRSFQTVTCFAGTSLAQLSKWVGTPVDLLVGVDILNNFDMQINPANETLLVSDEPLLLSGERLTLEELAGIPIIKGIIGTAEVLMYFDTGAKLSYFTPEVTGNLHSVGTAEDFYPGFGPFRTPLFDVQIALGAELILIRAGNLPTQLQTMLRAATADGILGSAVMRSHEVLFAPRRKSLSLQRLTTL